MRVKLNLLIGRLIIAHERVQLHTVNSRAELRVVDCSFESSDDAAVTIAGSAVCQDDLGSNATRLIGEGLGVPVRVRRSCEVGLGDCTAEGRRTLSKEFLVKQILRSLRTQCLCGEYFITENPEQP